MEIYPNEVWRPVEGFETYDVSNWGRVRSWNRTKNPNGRILKPQEVGGETNSRYHAVRLYRNIRKNDGSMKKEVKLKYVHRLVLKAFVGPPPTPDHQANHKNCDKQDNRLDNLEWVTASENIAHALENGRMNYTHMFGNTFRRKLTDEQAQEIYRRVVAGENRGVLADEFNIHPQTVTYIHNGEAYADVSGYTGKVLDEGLSGACKFTGREAVHYYKRLMNGEKVKDLAEEAGVSYQVMYYLKRGKTYTKYIKDVQI